MKKQLLKLMVLAFIAPLVFVACNDDEGTPSIEPDMIARYLHGDETIEVSEGSSSIIELPVFINYRHDGPVRINYEVEGDMDAFELLSDMGTVVIPAEQRQGKILLKPVDNDEFNDPYNSVTFRITGADSGYMLPDGVSIGYEEKTIVFVDNDCMPGDRDNWVGDLDALDVGYASHPSTGRKSEDNCDQLIIAGNLPGTNAGLTPDFVFTFTGSGGTGTVECLPQPYADNTYESSGTYDVSTMEITVDYVYRNDTGGVIWTGTNIITPN